MFLFQWLSFSIILKVLCIVLKNKIEILFFFLKVNSGNNNHRQRKRRLNVCKEKYTAFIGDTFFSLLCHIWREILSTSNEERKEKYRNRRCLNFCSPTNETKKEFFSIFNRKICCQFLFLLITWMLMQTKSSKIHALKRNKNVLSISMPFRIMKYLIET